MGLQLSGVAKMLSQNGITLHYTDAAVALLAKAGFDPEFGARPVKRAIQSMVLNRLSQDIIAQRVDNTRPITIDAAGGEITFSN